MKKNESEQQEGSRGREGVEVDRSDDRSENISLEMTKTEEGELVFLNYNVTISHLNGRIHNS